MDRLTGDEAARVFRRAAELEAAREARDPEARLDLDAVEAAGREAGLSPRAVREAVAELRARGVPGSAAPTVAAKDAVAARTVDGSVRPVFRAVCDFLEGQLLTPVGDLGDRTVWLPESGIEAAVARRVEGVDLRKVRRVVAGVVPVPGERRTHVRLEADVSAPSLVLRVGVPMTTAVAGGAAALVEPVAGAAVAAGGAALALVGWISARAQCRAARRRVAETFEHYLDWLEAT